MKRQVVFTEDNLKTLEMLLNRVNLKGAEVPAFGSLINSLQNSKEYKEPKKKLPKISNVKLA